MAERTPLGWVTTRIEDEWMGEVRPEEVIIGGKIGTWEDEICGMALYVENRNKSMDAKRFLEYLWKQREYAARVFGRTGEDGEAYQFQAVMYYAAKLCLRRRELRVSMDKIQTIFWEEQAADRIIKAHFDDFKTFFAEQCFRVSRERKTEEDAVSLTLLEKARDRYELHVEYRETKEAVLMLELELEESPFHRCREALEQLDRAVERIRGEKLPEEELVSLIDRMKEAAAIYNQHHEAAEELERTIVPEIKKLREREERLAYELNLEVPHTNRACAEAIRRLREGGDEGRETAGRADVPPMADPKSRPW